MNIVICEGEPVLRGQIRQKIIADDRNINIREVASAEDLKDDTEMDMLFVGLRFWNAKQIQTTSWRRKDGVEVPIVFVTSASQEDPLIFHTKSTKYTLRPDQIVYIESVSKKLEIHTPDETVEIYGSLTQMEEKLDDRFYRCHRSYLVNLSHVRGYRGDCIVMDNGDVVFMSRARYNEFEKIYTDYIGRDLNRTDS